MKKTLFLTVALAFMSLINVAAQNVGREVLTNDSRKAVYLETIQDTIKVGYNDANTFVGVMGNTDYTVTPNDAWLSAELVKGGLVVNGAYSYLTQTRTGSLTLTSTDGTFSRNLYVTQNSNTSANEIQGDTKLTIASATADQTQSGYPIKNTYDNSTSTYWHTPWGSTTTTFPVTLTYTLKEGSHVDYMVYTPRQDGNTNGNFKSITVAYATSASPNTFKTLSNENLNGSSSSSQIKFGEEGIDDVIKVKITVKSGEGNFASCSEMGFYQRNQEFASLVKKYFKNDLCTELADGVTLDEASKIENGFIRQLVTYMLSGEYSTKYRVGEFEPYEDVWTLRDELKNSSPYSQYENPTGIYFEKGQTLAIFVEGITDVSPSLKIYCFGEGDDFQTSSTYGLSNGVNVITTTTRGNGYIMYYSDKWESLPNVKIHFAMATENGYFDLERGDTNADWVELLANAKSDVLDIRCKRMQVPAPVSILRSKCPKKGVELAKIYDNVIYREREVMGLVQGIPGFTPEPKNRQFARPASSGMFASTEGAYAAFGSFGEWCNADDFGFWGIGHELGHNNQITNGFKWVGCGETTNNIYASWVEHKLGSGYHRLEDEITGVDAYSGMRGGRFETYLEEGVRKGVCWQLQDGPDYHGNAADGTNGSRNYDHFVKVVPLYQLNLWTQDCEKSPNAYGKVIQGYRNLKNNPSDNGQQQLNFMRNFCDSTKIDFLDFFEKAGMFKPINAYIEDYSAGWLKITEAQVKTLRDYIDGKGYPKAPAALNYINAYNIENFRNEVALDTTQTLGKGCSKNGNWVTVTHSYWKGCVGFETYNENDECVGISMYGLGDSQKSNKKTKVLFPDGSKYIMAVGYDGTKVKIYEK